MTEPLQNPPEPLRLPTPLQHRLDAAILRLYQPRGRAAEDFAHPSGEAALIAPDSVSWQVFKNPVSLFIGGVAAVILELAEPRVRSGVWEHTSFRAQPLERLQGTALAAVMTVYGPQSRARQMIDQVRRLHGRVNGFTPAGQAYHASDPELLDWVHATASFGFLEAYCRYVRPLDRAARDRFYAEGQPIARLYGATGAPASEAALEALFAGTRARLEPSAIVFEFLQIVGRMGALPAPLKPLQRLLVDAAVQITPAWARERLGLGSGWSLGPWQRVVVDRLARTGERLLLGSSAAVQSCRRLGLPDDYLYRERCGARD